MSILFSTILVMNYRYNSFQKFWKIIYRHFCPVATSPWTKWHVDDICDINLVPPEKLKSFFSRCIQILQNIKGEDIGDYLEFWVFNGSSLSSMYLTANKMKLNSMRFFGFDAFQGLPAWSEKEDDGVWEKWFYACSFDDMANCIRRKNIDPDDIHWIKWRYSDTLNATLVENYSLTNIAIVFIDCDTYSSSKTVLDFLSPLICSPAIFCFDDRKLNDLDIKGMGEYRSFNEFLETNKHLQAKEIQSYNRKSKSFLITPSSSA